MTESDRVMGIGSVVRGLLWDVYVLVCVLAAGVWIFHVLPNKGQASNTVLRALYAWMCLAVCAGAAALSLCRRYPAASFLLIPFGFFPAAMVYGFAFFNHTHPDGQLLMGFGIAFGTFFGAPVGAVLSLICWLGFRDRCKPNRSGGAP